MTGPAGRVMVHEKRLNLRFMFQVYKLTVEITSSQRCRYSCLLQYQHILSLPSAVFDSRARPTFVNYMRSCMALSVWVSIRHQGWVALLFGWGNYSELQTTTNVVSTVHRARINFVTNVSVCDIQSAHELNVYV